LRLSLHTDLWLTLTTQPKKKNHSVVHEQKLENGRKNQCQKQETKLEEQNLSKKLLFVQKPPKNY
jgi:hypothetical protein